MKRKALLATLIITIANLGTAINVVDVATDPNQPRYDESVDVIGFIDGEGRDVVSVEADIREDGELIQQDVPLGYVDGREQDISHWLAFDAFNTTFDDGEDHTYDVTVQAIDSVGNEDTKSLIIDVNQNSTQIQDVDPDTVTDERTVIFGFTMRDIILLLIVTGLVVATLLSER